MQALRVTDPAALSLKPVQEFLLKAGQASKISQPGKAIADLAEMLANPKVGCWLTVDAQKGPLAVVVCVLPQSAFMEQPQIPLIYSLDPEAKKLALAQALEFSKQAGYNKFWGINRSGYSDDQMAEIFEFAGFVHPVGSMLEYEF